MIWCRFQDDDQSRYGIVDGDSVTAVTGTPFGEYTTNGRTLPYADLKLLPPTIPSTFFCVGLNYRGHIEHAAKLGNPVAKLPERPEIGYRANNALIGHGDEIVEGRHGGHPLSGTRNTVKGGADKNSENENQQDHDGAHEVVHASSLRGSCNKPTRSRREALTGSRVPSALPPTCGQTKRPVASWRI